MAKNEFMGRQLYIRTIALFMILLVLSLPYTFAASITGVGLTGTINAGQVVKPGDTVSVAVNITEAQGETLDATTLHQRLRLGTSTYFTSCQGSPTTTGQYTCFASFVLNPAQSSVIISPIDVLLFSDATKSVEIDRDANQLIVDGEAPTIAINSVTQYGASADVTISATDKALPSNVPASCSGIASVSLFWLNGTVSTPITTLSGNKDCAYTNVTSVTIPASGLFQLCAKATDRAGLNTQTCVARTFDISRPAISAIDIATAAGPTRYITGNGTQVYVTFNATSNSDQQGFNVTVDGTAVGPVSCDTLGACKAGPFSITQAKSYAIAISARTALGMTSSATQSIAITVDSVAPAFTALKTNLTIGTKNYFKPGVSITAHFAEEATGLGNKDARLLIEGTSIGVPSRCVKPSTGGWDCVWERVAYNTTRQGNLSVIVSANDLLGNVGANGNATLVYDTLPPAVDMSTLNLTAIGSSGASSIAASGAILKVTFNVTDASGPISAKGDFTAFEPISNQTTNSCTATRCEVTSRPIGVGPYLSPASITISDVLGNNATFSTQSLEVLRTSNETNTSYFRHSLKLTPAALEVTTFPYTNQRGYAVIDVRGVGPAKVLKVDFKQCRNIPVVTLAANGSVVSGSSAFSTTSTSTGDTRLFKSSPQITVVNESQLFVAFTFKATELNQSNIQFLCDVDVMGRVADTFIPRETETVLVNFSTYKLSVGELGENYDKKLADQIKKAQNHIGSKLDSLEKLFDILQKLCRLIQAIQIVTGVIGLIGGHVKTSAIPLAATVITIPFYGAVQVTGTSACLVSELGDTGLDLLAKFGPLRAVCNFVNCKDGLLSKFAPTTLAANAATGAGHPVIGDMLAAIDPQETLAGAVLNLCLPGIIKQLRRAQQIECQYALCLRDDVPNGIPIEACDLSYEYSSCVYKTGNFFILGALWDKFMGMLKSLVADPFAVAGTAASAICIYMCANALPPSGPLYTVCKTGKLLSRIGALVQAISSVKNDWTKNNYAAQDYCSQLEG